MIFSMTSLRTLLLFSPSSSSCLPDALRILTKLRWMYFDEEMAQWPHTSLWVCDCHHLTVFKPAMYRALLRPEPISTISSSNHLIVFCLFALHISVLPIAAVFTFSFLGTWVESTCLWLRRRTQNYVFHLHFFLFHLTMAVRLSKLTESAYVLLPFLFYSLFLWFYFYPFFSTPYSIPFSFFFSCS